MAAIASLLFGKTMLFLQAPCSGSKGMLYKKPPYCVHRSLCLSLPANWASYPTLRKPLDFYLTHVRVRILTKEGMNGP